VQDERPSAPAGERKPRILITVEVEDYFHVGRFDQLIPRERWYRFEGRVAASTRRALDLVESCGARATFFVLGWVAEQVPELVREIAARGHELASLGYDRRTVKNEGARELRADATRAREALERASGLRVLGYRMPHYIGPRDLWVLDMLAEEGFAYDSSIKPLFRRFAREPWRRLAHLHQAGARSIWEFPLSAAQPLGLSIPIAGAGYLRHFPEALMQRAIGRWLRRHDAPFVMYFRAWELDPGQPQIQGPLHERLRHYRNIEKMASRLEGYLRRYPACGIAAHLGLDPRAPAPAPDAAPGARASEPALVLSPSARGSAAAGETAAPAAGGGERPPVTLVVPCYNEEASLAYLDNTLRSVSERLGSAYDLRFVFVDDASRDGTRALLERHFGGRPECTILQHERNRGVAAAIMTGLRAARTEVVCSMDCDCTYDPHELGRMIPLLAPGVALVTASPYHPLGSVKNLPAWRLALSRGASLLYRLVLPRSVHTFTSCFRVYRRESVAGIELREGGFLGIAEMLARLLLAGGTVVEHPAVLEVRLLGHSKMSAARGVLGHLGLLSRLALLRVRRAVSGGFGARPPAA
jgi:polysaccharide deacetylase family protein (PEP-CTERM system associated)